MIKKIVPVIVLRVHFKKDLSEHKECILQNMIFGITLT